MLQTAYPAQLSRPRLATWPRRSPIAAMLWENWALTRSEAAWRMALGLAGGSVALAVSDSGATIAVWILLGLHGIFWASIAKLTGGRAFDGYRPGFPLPLLFTRPVRTSAIVAAAMLYDALSGAAMYAASAALLGFAFDQTLPVLPLAPLIVVFHIVCTFVQWSTRSRVFQWLGSCAIWSAVLALFAIRGDGSPMQLDFSTVETAGMVAIGLVSFALTVAGVARQRRGDARETVPRTKSSGAADWFAGLFRFPCPTSSPTAGQIWFELRTSGVPILVLGLTLAISVPLLLLITTRLDILLSSVFTEPATRIVPVTLAMFSPPAVLILGGNAFGVRGKQGRTDVSMFNATQAYGTARMAVHKVLVRSACLFPALAAVVASIWISASVIPFDVLGDNDTFIVKSRSPASGVMRAIEGAVVAMDAYERLALAFVAFVAVTVMVALRASFAALRARYRRSASIVGSLLLTHVFVLVLLVMAEQAGFTSPFVLDKAREVTSWILGAGIVLATIYLFWTALAERLLTPRQAYAACLVSAAFGVAWMIVLGAAGVPLGTMSETELLQRLSPALLPLLASVLAPWSLSRIRHT